jgi:hypothetical protein
VAEIWGAVVIGGATLAKGYMDSKAAKRAGNASAAGADRAADVQWDMFNKAYGLAGIHGAPWAAYVLGD